MKTVKYRNVDTFTPDGLRLAEKLKLNGWVTVYVGLYIIKFMKKV